VQLVPLSAADWSTDPVRQPDAPASVQRLPALLPLAATDPAPQAAQPGLHRGLNSLNPQINQQVATAQQTLDFLGGLSSQLQAFKTQLNRELSGGFVKEGALANQRQHLQQLWQERQVRSSGGLNDQLDYSGDGQALQHFRIRGLDAFNLQSKANETLTFSLAGTPRQTRAVQVGPGLPMSIMASRFDQALAPAGIRVTVNAQGELDFAVPQSQWAQVQDGLMIKGDGKRFPTGEFSRLRLAAEPAAIAPTSWQIDTLAEQRQTLSQVVQAVRRVAQVSEKVQRVLADTHQTLSQQSAAAGATEAASFTQGFAALVLDPRYSSLSTLATSLQGLPRYRIENLLALRAEA
jgi:hypothetical protein